MVKSNILLWNLAATIRAHVHLQEIISLDVTWREKLTGAISIDGHGTSIED